MKMAGELCGDMPGRRRMTREVAQRRLSLRQAGLSIAPPQEALFARLVGARVKLEAAGVVILARPRQTPSGEDHRQIPHVALIVAAVDAEGVKLQDLPSQILVQALLQRRPAAESGPKERALSR